MPARCPQRGGAGSAAARGEPPRPSPTPPPPARLPAAPRASSRRHSGGSSEQRRGSGCRGRRCGGCGAGGGGSAAPGGAGEARGRMPGVAAILLLLQLLPKAEGQGFAGEGPGVVFFAPPPPEFPQGELARSAPPQPAGSSGRPWAASGRAPLPRAGSCPGSRRRSGGRQLGKLCLCLSGGLSVRGQHLPCSWPPQRFQSGFTGAWRG